MNERQEHLRQYVVACMRDNILTPADLMSFQLGGKLVRTLSADMRVVLVELGRIGMRGIGAKLMQLADDVIPSTRRK